MLRAKIVAYILAAGCALVSTSQVAQAQEGEKQKHKKESKQKWGKEKEYKEKEYKRETRYENDSRPARGTVGDILGRVILPPRGTAGPRQLAGVPKGHYPPPGECRIWYPNRPPGHQPPPTSCDRLIGARLEPGAFILHGDQAYDAEYDWRTEERRRPGSVTRDILDILFPQR